MNETPRTKESRDPKALWDALFKMFDAMLLETPSDELDFRMQVTPLMHSLRLILQSLDYAHWDLFRNTHFRESLVSEWE